MKSRRKRVYSLLSSALVFSSFGYVSGMEEPEKTTIGNLLNVKRQNGNKGIQAADGTPNAQGLALRKLASILCHFFAKICGSNRQADTKISGKLRSKLQSFTALNRSEELRKIVSDIKLTKDEFKELDIWHKAFVRVRKIFMFNLDDSDKKMFTFLYQFRDIKLKLESSKYILCCNEAMNEEKKHLPPHKRKLGYELQKKINVAMNKILKILVPEVSWNLEINIFDLTDTGILEVNGTGISLNLQED